MDDVNFVTLKTTQPVLAAEAGTPIGAVYGEEERAQKLGLRGDALRDHRQNQVGPIVREFHLWLDGPVASHVWVRSPQVTANLSSVLPKRRK